MHNYTISTRRP